jgi:hypothetical protein
MENELPADTEQCPPHALAFGLDHSDFLAAMAPKPVTILAKERDYFDARGAEEAYTRLRQLYSLLGAAENVGLFIGPTPHGYSQENREAMYQWFNRATGASDATTEPPIVLEKDQTLWCTPTGQVTDLRSRTVFSYTRDRSRSLASQRRPLSGSDLAKAITERLQIPDRIGVPEYRILRPKPNRKYPMPHAGNYRVETEPGMFAAVYRLSDVTLLSRPPRGMQQAVLYVSHHSADAELREDPWFADLVGTNAQAAFYACDVRGVGESRPDTCGGPDQFTRPYGNDYFYAIHGLMLDRPYVGQKTFDVLRVLDWLGSLGHQQVHLAAKGWGTIPATFAATLSPIVTQVTLKNALTSYQDVAESEDYNWPLSSFVPNVLAVFDLPDCYRELQAKQLRQIDPVGAVGRIR